MRIYNIEVHGFDRALCGLARSYNQDPERMKTVALSLAPLDKGHNKFLESIVLWVEIEAPRFFWSEFDTYRGDLEDMKGITKQSDSTMHTLKRSPLTQENFEYDIHPQYLNHLNDMILNNEPIEKIKNALPDGFIQGRTICTSYKVVRNILIQRHNHKLPQWRLFCATLKEGLPYYDYLGVGKLTDKP